MAQVIEYKCPRCGGTLEFSSALQKLQCPYCESVFALEEVSGKDEVLDSAETDSLSTEEGVIEDFTDEGVTEFTTETTWSGDEADSMNVYQCSSCRGEIIATDTTAATRCPYCGNVVMLTGRLSGDLKPDLVIPFKLDKEAAKEALRRRMSGKKLVPRAFTDESTLDEIQGLYVPYWIIDTDSRCTLRYECTQTKIWSDRDYNYTQTSYFDVVRQGIVAYDDIPCDASEKMSDDLMDSIEPYDMSEAVPFRTAYLSGYTADRFDTPSDVSVERATRLVRNSTVEALAQTVSGYATQTLRNHQVALTNVKTKYALLPVWIMNVNWNNTLYTFAMNGQTGKIVGNLPSDKSLALKERLKYMLYIGIPIAIGAIAALFM